MKRKKLLTSILMLIVAIGIKLFNDWKENQIPGSEGKVPTPESVDDSFFTKVRSGSSEWEVLKNCKLITGRNSDGDSFHVKHSGGEDEFRLYFADTPESEYKTYGGGENNGKRLDDQAEYFGISREQVIDVGKEAKSFTLRLLKKEPFKIVTKWEPVIRQSPERKHAYVIVHYEGREVYLHELLVSRGLVRIHTRGAAMPGGRSYHEQKAHLQNWEKSVKEKKIGGWGM